MSHTTSERHVCSFYRTAKDLPDSIKHILWPCSIYQCTLNLVTNNGKLNLFERVILRLMDTGVYAKEQLAELTCLPSELVYSIQLGLQAQRYLDLDLNLTTLGREVLFAQEASDSVSFASKAKDSGRSGVGSSVGHSVGNSVGNGGSGDMEGVKLYIFMDDISGEILNFATSKFPQHLPMQTVEHVISYSFGQVGKQDYFENPLKLQAESQRTLALKPSAVLSMLRSFQRHKQNLENDVRFQGQNLGGIVYQYHSFEHTLQGSIRLVISAHSTPIYLHCLGELGMTFRVFDPFGLDQSSSQLSAILQHNQLNNSLLQSYLKQQHVALSKIAEATFEDTLVQGTVYDEATQHLLDSFRLIKNAYAQLQQALQQNDLLLVEQSYGEAIRLIYSNLEELLPQTLELTKRACNLFKLKSSNQSQIFKVLGTAQSNEKILRNYLKQQGFSVAHTKLYFTKYELQRCYDGQLDYLDLICCIIFLLQRAYSSQIDSVIATNAKLPFETKSIFNLTGGQQELPATEANQDIKSENATNSTQSAEHEASTTGNSDTYEVKTDGQASQEPAQDAIDCGSTVESTETEKTDKTVSADEATTASQADAEHSDGIKGAAEDKETVADEAENNEKDEAVLITITPRLNRILASLSAQEPDLFNKLQQLRLERNSLSHGSNFAHKADPENIKSMLGLLEQVLSMLYDKRSTICLEVASLATDLATFTLTTQLISQEQKTQELLQSFSLQQIQVLPDIIYNVSQDILDLESPGQNLVNDLYQVAQQFLHTNFNQDTPVPEKITAILPKSKQPTEANKLRYEALLQAKDHALKAGFKLEDNKLPKNLLSINSMFLLHALTKQTNTTLGAEIIAFLLLMPLEQLKVLAQQQPDMLNILSKLLELRGHGTNHTSRKDACELKNQVFNVLQCLLTL